MAMRIEVDFDQPLTRNNVRVFSWPWQCCPKPRACVWWKGDFAPWSWARPLGLDRIRSALQDEEVPFAHLRTSLHEEEDLRADDVDVSLRSPFWERFTLRQTCSFRPIGRYFFTPRSALA